MWMGYREKGVRRLGQVKSKRVGRVMEVKF